MRRRQLWFSCILLGFGCAAPLKEFYPGTFLPEQRIYQNKPIGFSLAYRGNWDITTDPNRMKAHRKFARELHHTGAELLFIGFTMEKTQGTRCIVSNLNETNWEYAEQIQLINRAQIDSDNGLTNDTVGTVPVVRWEYSKDEFRFVEFFFEVDTYNLRVAFWAKPLLYGKFLPVYKEIMGTLALSDKH
jgi:hypothetical protein